MNHGIIPNYWLAVVDSWSPRDLLPLLDEVERRGIDHRNLKAVREVWEDLNRNAGKTR
jgi:hypothetical protein